MKRVTLQLSLVDGPGRLNFIFLQFCWDTEFTSLLWSLEAHYLRESGKIGGGERIHERGRTCGEGKKKESKNMWETEQWRDVTRTREHKTRKQLDGKKRTYTSEAAIGLLHFDEIDRGLGNPSVVA